MAQTNKQTFTKHTSTYNQDKYKQTIRKHLDARHGIDVYMYCIGINVDVRTGISEHCI